MPGVALDRIITPEEERAAERRLHEARALRKAGRVRRAARAYTELLSRFPDYVAALYELALIHIENEDFEKALPLMHRAAIHDPKDFRILSNLAALYHELEAYEMAERTCRFALELRPDSAITHFNLGKIYQQQKEYEKAAAAFRTALDLDPRYFLAAIELGQCCEHLGRLEEAADIYHRSMEMGSGDVSVSLYALSDLPASLVRVDLVAALLKLREEPRNPTPEDELDFTFTLARALDKAGRYEEAWENLVKANAIMRERRRADYEIGRDFEVQSLRWARQCPVVVAPPSPAEAGEPVPLFILGTSRSGKSTVERLLSACPGVRCGYENQLVAESVKATNQAAGRLTSSFFPALPEELYPLFGQFYRDGLRRRGNGASIFTTTTPSLIVNVPRLIAIIPGTRFIFVKRDRMDTAIRLFFKKYRIGNDYSYDIKWIFGHIEWYHEMIDMFAERYAARCLVLDYSEVVAEPAVAAQRIARFCGLPEPAGGLPSLGDDRGCAAPYREWMEALAAAA